MTVMQKQTARQLALLSNGSYSTGKGNAQNDYIWDRVKMPNKIQSQGIPFFRTPTGAQYGNVAGDLKTMIETSMEDNGKLPKGQNFLCNAVTIQFCTSEKVEDVDEGGPVTASDRILHAWAVYMQHTDFNFKFTNTEYSWRSPGTNFLPSVYQNGASAPYATGEFHVRSGDFDHFSWLTMPTKIPITEQVNFSVTGFTSSASLSIRQIVNNAMFFLATDTPPDVYTDPEAEIQTTVRGMLTRAL